MSSQVPLEQVWRQQLATLVEEARAGAAIWRRPEILAGGLPVHARSLQPFPGIDALVLWRFGPGAGSWGWRVVEGDEGPVVGVPDKGGRRLVRVAASEVRSPKRVPRMGALDLIRAMLDRLPEGWPHALTEELVLALSGLGFWIPPAPAAVASDTELLRVAGVAQLIAWAVVVEPERKGEDALETLAASVALRELLPAELRAPAGRKDPLPVWDRPVDPVILLSRRGTLAPQLPVLVHEVQNWKKKDSILIYNILSDSSVFDGLLRTEVLSVTLALNLTGAPGQDWRQIGRALRRRIQGGPADARFVLDLAGGDAVVAEAIMAVWQGHRRRSWLHRRSSVSVHELRDLVRRRSLRSVPEVAKGAEPSRGDDSPLDLPLSRVALPFIAGCLDTWRGRKAPSGLDEAALFRELLSALNQGWPGEVDTWAELRGRVGTLRYTRRPLRKQSGGLRWLDVPPPGLAAAQRRLHEILRVRLPRGATAMAFVPRRGVPWHARAHAGCQAAVVVDIQDFFGSVRPRHLRPWLFPDEADPWRPRDLLAGCSVEARRAVLDLLFVQRDGSEPYLAQGAPSSPIASHLAACRMDGLVVARAEEAFGAGSFEYTRYADDLVLSSRCAEVEPEFFVEKAHEILISAVLSQGWRTNKAKTRRWLAGRGGPLSLCGLVLPATPEGPLRLPPEEARRVRAAMHRLRTRACYRERGPDLRHSLGMAAWAYAATGDPRLLAWTSPRLAHLAEALAGPLFLEAFLAGWADDVDDLLPPEVG